MLLSAARENMKVQELEMIKASNLKNKGRRRSVDRGSVNLDNLAKKIRNNIDKDITQKEADAF